MEFYNIAHNLMAHKERMDSRRQARQEELIRQLKRNGEIIRRDENKDQVWFEEQLERIRLHLVKHKVEFTGYDPEQKELIADFQGAELRGMVQLKLRSGMGGCHNPMLFSKPGVSIQFYYTQWTKRDQQVEVKQGKWAQHWYAPLTISTNGKGFFVRDFLVAAMLNMVGKTKENN